VVNTHLHFDHCGGNHLFAGRPIYVQRRELHDARNEEDYGRCRDGRASGRRRRGRGGVVRELDEPSTECQLRVRALDRELVWLAHEDEPWRPRTA
jgi:N-acyl homoserine lactone hydrolase